MATPTKESKKYTEIFDSMKVGDEFTFEDLFTGSELQDTSVNRRKISSFLNRLKKQKRVERRGITRSHFGIYKKLSHPLHKLQQSLSPKPAPAPAPVSILDHEFDLTELGAAILSHIEDLHIQMKQLRKEAKEKDEEVAALSLQLTQLQVHYNKSQNKIEQLNKELLSGKGGTVSLHRLQELAKGNSI